MAESYRTRLLEVSLTAIKPDQWEWQVFENDTPIMTSYRASPQDTARHASNGGERNGSAVVARGISGANVKSEGITHFSAVAATNQREPVIG